MEVGAFFKGRTISWKPTVIVLGGLPVNFHENRIIELLPMRIRSTVSKLKFIVTTNGEGPSSETVRFLLLVFSDAVSEANFLNNEIGSDGVFEIGDYKTFIMRHNFDKLVSKIADLLVTMEVNELGKPLSFQRTPISAGDGVGVRNSLGASSSSKLDELVAGVNFETPERFREWLYGASNEEPSFGRHVVSLQGGAVESHCVANAFGNNRFDRAVGGKVTTVNSNSKWTTYRDLLTGTNDHMRPEKNHGSFVSNLNSVCSTVHDSMRSAFEPSNRGVGLYSAFPMSSSLSGNFGNPVVIKPKPCLLFEDPELRLIRVEYTLYSQNSLMLREIFEKEFGKVSFIRVFEHEVHLSGKDVDGVFYSETFMLPQGSCCVKFETIEAHRACLKRKRLPHPAQYLHKGLPGEMYFGMMSYSANRFMEAEVHDEELAMQLIRENNDQELLSERDSMIRKHHRKLIENRTLMLRLKEKICFVCLKNNRTDITDCSKEFVQRILQKY